METKKLPLKNLLIVLILLVVSFGVYTNSLQGGFVWDDTTLFIEHYDAWQWKHLKRLLTSQDNLFEEGYTGYYRPLPNITFLIDRSIWGQNPFGYHLTNIAFHIASVIAVFFIAQALFGNLFLGAITGLLFAVHPVHTEVVAWINGRNNAVSGFFYLVAFYGYMQFRKSHSTKNLILSMGSFACSLLSKEYAFTFPIMIGLYEISFYSKNSAFRFSDHKVRIAWLTYALIMLAYLVIRAFVLPASSPGSLNFETIWFRILTVPKTILIYLKLLIFPFNLNARYNTSYIASLFNPEFLLQTAGLAAILILWIWSFRRSKTIFFSVGWILVTLLPVLNIIPVSYGNTFLAERYLYLPAAGVCLTGTVFFKHVFDFDDITKFRLWRYVSILILLIVVETFAFQTAKRNLIWKSNLTLWQDTVKKSPHDFQVRCNLAIAFHDAGRLDEALIEIRQALRLEPTHDTPYFILGQILYEKGRFEEASQALTVALTINPAHRDALDILGNMQHAQNSAAKKVMQDKLMQLNTR